MWLVRLFQTLVGHINTLLGFAVLAFVFLMLALLETGDFRERLAAASKQAKGPDLAKLGEKIAAKFRKYTLVRTQMSALTGLAVWALRSSPASSSAPAWGIIAFVLNYIPFIGSFVATLLPASSPWRNSRAGRTPSSSFSACSRSNSPSATISSRCSRRGTFHFATRGHFCRILLELPVGHPRRVHRRAHHHRHSHSVRAVSLQPLDRDASVGRAAKSRRRAMRGLVDLIEEA